MAWRAYKKDRSRKTWTISGRDHLDLPRQMPAFKNADGSRELARNIEALVHHRAGRSAWLASHLPPYFQSLRPDLRERLAEWGLLDVQNKPLKTHLADYEAVLSSRGSTDKAVALVVHRLRQILEGCNATYWSDVTGAGVSSFIGSLRAGGRMVNGRRVESREATPQTRNHYLVAIKGFAAWAVKEGRIAQSPVAHLTPIPRDKVEAKRRIVRRAASIEEIRTLIDITDRTGIERFGMTGYERSLLYRLAVETGLRASELMSLTASSFQLHGDEPAVAVDRSATKNSKGAIIPLRAETASRLAPHLQHKTPKAPAFTMPTSLETADMLRADLADAGIAFRNEAGQVLDFHALRHTCGTWLSAAGVHPKLIQRIMRHSTITLTMDRYTHAFKADEAAAVAKLPTLDNESQRVTATGTYDAAPVSPATSADGIASAGRISGRATDTTTDSKRVMMDESAPRRAFSKPPAGFEPATCGLQNRCSAN